MPLEAPIYFSNFEPTDEEITVGRNSVSHGVASAESFDAKAAVIGFLTVNQLFFCLQQDLGSSP